MIEKFRENRKKMYVFSLKSSLEKALTLILPVCTQSFSNLSSSVKDAVKAVE